MAVAGTLGHDDTLLFRSTLAELGLTIGGLTRVMIRHGDCRPATTIKRRMRRIANGEIRLSGEMRVILGMLRRGRGVAAGWHDCGR
jgi:hypothetical protein